MATITFNGESFTVDHAVKGENFVHGYDANGICVISLDGVNDFSGITYDGTYMEPGECLEEACNVVKYCNGVFKTADGKIISTSGGGGEAIVGNGNPPTGEYAIGTLYFDLDSGTLYINTATITDVMGNVTSNAWAEVSSGGGSGEDGGYYVPTVTQVDEYTAKVSFTPSKEGMTEAAEQTIQLPPGADGKDGVDGTSVTVKSVSESTADGGSNVVTFSDGKTLTVKNGSKGSDGPAGADGKSAYAYAIDGGYTGTEAEFGAKLAEEAPKAFYVTVTNNGDGTFPADKTLEEIKAAYDAGRAVYCLAEVDGFQMIHGLVTFVEEEGYSAALFASPVFDGIITSVLIDTETVAVSTEEISQSEMESLTIKIGNSAVTYNGTADKFLNVQSLKNPNALTINGVSYDGSEAVNVETPKMLLITATDGVANKTSIEILSASLAGYTVCFDAGGTLLPLVSNNGEIAQFMLTLAVGADGFGTVWASVTSNGTAVEDSIITSALPNPNAMTVNGTSYDGSEAVDFTDTINGMIDAKTPTALKNPNALTFTGGVTGTYDGSSAKTVNIPTTLKNPNALTFTGAVTGTYDGSAAKTVNIPTVPSSLKNPNALTINGTSYDGSAAVNLSIEGGVDSPYKGKNMSVIGASFEAYGYYIPAEADVWWRKLANALEMNVLVADGVSGSVVCGATEGSTAGCGTRCVNLHSGDTNPDVVFVSFGGNDFKLYALGSYDPATTALDITTSRTISTFREAYAVMLGKIMNTYPQAEVYCLTRPLAKAMPYTNTSGDTFQMWNDAIVEIATKMGATPVRMEYCGINRYNRSIYAPVENHPNAEGQSLMANQAIQTVDPSCAVRYGVTESDTPGDDTGSGSGDTEDSGNYTNLIPTALDTDLDGIYNEIGYKNGAYVSTETNATTGTKWATGTVGTDVATGLFPYSSLSPVDGSNTYKPPTIYMKGVTFSAANSHCRILLMNGTTFVQCLYLTKTLTSNWTVTELGEKYYKLEPIMSADGKNAFTTNGYAFTHIAISAIGYGEDWVITFDEPIE